MKDGMKEWFDQQDFDQQPMPDGHEQRFLARLEAACEEEFVPKERTEKQKGQFLNGNALLKWSAAAVIAILIGSASFYMGQSQSYELRSVSPAMAKAQNNYVEVIDQQLTALNKLQSPATERIIADAKANLQKLQTDYTKIQMDFKSNSENPAVIDAMIQNFKNRILLLESARAQINSQQQQIKTQENEIL